MPSVLRRRMESLRIIWVSSQWTKFQLTNGWKKNQFRDSLLFHRSLFSFFSNTTFSYFSFCVWLSDTGIKIQEWKSWWRARDERTAPTFPSEIRRRKLVFLSMLRISVRGHYITRGWLLSPSFSWIPAISSANESTQMGNMWCQRLIAFN